ncbi:MAG TPA: YsnF/AvaK domain-containing protein [Thermomicrobiaceae bacterium]|nr:YsnF/AvaK domain-containing protein [Thermomicrobiaceae bacterium]
MERMPYDEQSGRTWDVNSIQHGWDVLDANGDKVGDVSDVQPTYLTVRKGFLFHSDRYIPVSAIDGVRHDRVYLNVTKDQIDQQGWDTVPTTDRGVYGTLDRDVDRTGTTAQTGQMTEETMRLREERLRARKEQVQTGAVNVDKDVVTEERSMDVPVTHDEVTVERRRVPERPASEPIKAGDERDITVPVREERVTAEKEPVVYEEVDVKKQPVTERRRVAGTVRREEAHVEQQGDVDVDGTDTELPEDARPPV